ncbi:MAG TPA: DNA-processing protein DprA [Candidatus Hydrogenedentes bacterium]|nr:DNA-processing protein DprA [Candidatus Hydrogenedentota bacterium]HOL76870.1 DNA-processing protein DprA [Candidatus Hydrogenedentota bacterium]HPO85521.1 DNA-processing protein DprA [Candidatus Hydrogenedentota bacterium]
MSDEEDIKEKAAAILALMMTPGGGRVRVNEIINACRRKSIEFPDVLVVPLQQSTRLFEHLSPSALSLIAQCGEREKRRAKQLVERVIRSGGYVLVCDRTDYPSSLKNHLGKYVAPLLWTFGSLSLLKEDGAAVVGRTKPSFTGRICAETIACALASEHAPLVSGGAIGVDLAAHRAVLDAGGKTIVVLPQGLLTAKLPRWLEQSLAQGNAVLVSEFVPDAAWETYAAVTRNATIAALSSVVFVVEPGRLHGSARTAQCALEQNKQVVVISSEESSEMADVLVRAGARLVVEPDATTVSRIAKAIWQQRNSTKNLGGTGLLF